MYFRLWGTAVQILRTPTLRRFAVKMVSTRKTLNGVIIKVHFYWRVNILRNWCHVEIEILSFISSFKKNKEKNIYAAATKLFCASAFLWPLYKNRNLKLESFVQKCMANKPIFILFSILAKVLPMFHIKFIVREKRVGHDTSKKLRQKTSIFFLISGSRYKIKFWTPPLNSHTSIHVVEEKICL